MRCARRAEGKGDKSEISKTVSVSQRELPIELFRVTEHLRGMALLALENRIATVDRPCGNRYRGVGAAVGHRECGEAAKPLDFTCRVVRIVSSALLRTQWASMAPGWAGVDVALRNAKLVASPIK